MSDTVPTIKVKPWGDEQGSHVIINEADFDEAVHKKLSKAELAKLEAEAAGEPEGEAEGDEA